jgi:hypothetical protein
MRIHLESCHLSRVSGFVDPAPSGAAVVVRIGRHETVVPARTPRADLAEPSAFCHEIEDQERAALRDGATIEVGLPGAEAPQHVIRPSRLGFKGVAFAIPAGQVHGRDDVSWYEADQVEKNLFHYHNIGDSFVYDSSLKVLEATGFTTLPIAKINDAVIEQVNADCSAVVLRGSNYFHRHMDWMHAEKVFARITLPIICFGCGIQVPDGSPLSLTAAQIRVLHMLAEKAAWIGVRGTRSAEQLADFGVKNIKVIGCPTLFRHRDPGLAIKGFDYNATRKVAFNVRREVNSDYAVNPRRYLQRHRAIMDHFIRAKEVTVMTHGEVEEKIFAFKARDHIAKAEQTLLSQGWFQGEDDPLLKLYRERIFYSDYVKDYDSFARTQDLVTGYRLHGNLISLANAVPSFYMVYDDRTEEICETFSIPSFDVRKDAPFSQDLLRAPGLFDRFNAAVPGNYRVMTRFLEECGVPHRM